MVATQLRVRGIRDERVLEAMAAVPRHEFVPRELWSQADGDHPLPIGGGQTISQPYIVALMIEALAAEGDTVLEIGTGTGYEAAVLSRIAARVLTVERSSHSPAPPAKTSLVWDMTTSKLSREMAARACPARRPASESSWLPPPLPCPMPCSGSSTKTAEWLCPSVALMNRSYSCCASAPARSPRQVLVDVASCHWWGVEASRGVQSGARAGSRWRFSTRWILPRRARRLHVSASTARLCPSRFLTRTAKPCRCRAPAEVFPAPSADATRPYRPWWHHQQGTADILQEFDQLCVALLRRTFASTRQRHNASADLCLRYGSTKSCQRSVTSCGTRA